MNKLELIVQPKLENGWLYGDIFNASPYPIGEITIGIDYIDPTGKPHSREYSTIPKNKGYSHTEFNYIIPVHLSLKSDTTPSYKLVKALYEK